MSLFESSITGNVLNDGSTAEISGITAGQLATVLTAYTPLTETATNTASISTNATGLANNTAAIAALQTQVDNLPAAPDLAPYALASDLAAAMDSAEASIAALQAAGLQTAAQVASAITTALLPYTDTTGLNSLLAVRDGRLDGAESISSLQAAGFQTAAQVASAIASALLPYVQQTGLDAALALMQGRQARWARYRHPRLADHRPLCDIIRPDCC